MHVLALSLLPSPLLAGPPLLGLPVDCTLGRSCYIQQYFDRDPKEGAVQDHACGALANDGHSGTDFAVATLAEVSAGVTVVAAAPGTVLGIRDGMADISSLAENAPDLQGRDCGNGVVIDHGDGWTTQYCHLRQGSVVVEEGQRVAMGTPLGLVGMSGRASFPHLHLTLREGTEARDPFAPEPGPAPACALPAEEGATQDTAPETTSTEDTPRAMPGGRTGLWLEPPAYVPGGLIAVGLTDRVPTIAEVRSGLPTAAVTAPKAPAMVIWGYAFAGEPGDEIEIIFEGPEGEIGRHTDVLDKAQPFVLRAYGKRTPAAGWPWGTYSGTVIHRRDGAELGRRYIRTDVN
ncbi:M23 family metallopeptidase [Vannielia litorea]|uniref:M23 family metallopeptidase n=1 Tax=Vannielia litorea TaxID=1217970 RepID=UPI001588040F|nr:M23 family metallopeptidase [Vannielia litorea]